jgi:hypothetical protein
MSARRRIAVAMAALSLALAGALPAQAGAAEIGVNPVFQDPATSADTVGQLGARWVRAFVRWDQGYGSPARCASWRDGPRSRSFAG